MGNYMTFNGGPEEAADEHRQPSLVGSDEPNTLNGRPKRTHDDDSNSSTSGNADTEDSLLHTPRKKKMKTTTDYIYQVLFIEGENSDVTITALGKEWKLHKLYLKQCGYFESMFNGSWKEAQATTVDLDIPDENIDAEALSIAFGCLYRDDLTIEPVQVISVVAAASLLQLDGLLQQCAAIMKETISTKTVCEYYECATLYGLKHVETACFEWFENNIMCKQSRSLLKHISPTLMKELIKSPNLFVMQVEMDVYNLLKKWLFLQLVPSWHGSYKSGITKTAENHYKDVLRQEFGNGSQRSFLETHQGKKYRSVFASLRFQHIIIDLTSTNILFKDKIVPKDWLMPYFKTQWLTMLNVEQGDDQGPKSEDVDSQVFLDTSLRCARVLNKDTEYQWRWIGFNYGVDLVIMYANRLIIFKRNTSNQARLLSNQPNRNLMFRVTVSCLNDLGQVTFTKTGGIKSHSFDRDGELLGLSVDKKATMPLRIGLNVLYYTPKPELYVGNLLHIPLRQDNCHSCKKRTTVAALAPATAVNESDTCDSDIRQPRGSSRSGLSESAGTSGGHGDNGRHISGAAGEPGVKLSPAYVGSALSESAVDSDDQHDIHVENPLA